jgi:hypothetical protein
VISVTRGSQSRGTKVAMVRPSLKLAAVVVAVAALVLLGVVVVQQQQIGSLSRQVSQEAAGTILINGTRYNYIDVPLASLTYPAVLEFDGVTFNITAGSTGGYAYFTYPFNSHVAGSSGTVVTVTVSSGTLFGNSTSITVRLVPWPSVKITFGDGTIEYYHQSSTGVLSSQSAASPWFSQHSNPRAGIMWDSISNSYYLYVSIGS